MAAYVTYGDSKDNSTMVPTGTQLFYLPFLAPAANSRTIRDVFQLPINPFSYPTTLQDTLCCVVKNMGTENHSLVRYYNIRKWVCQFV